MRPNASSSTSKKIPVFLGCILMLVFAECLDLITRWDVSVLLFYVIPVWVAVWYFGLGIGTFFSIAAVLVEGYVDILEGHPDTRPWVIWWNGLMRLSTYLVVAYAILNVRMRSQEVRDLLAELQNTTNDAWEIGGLFPMCPDCKAIRSNPEYVQDLKNFLTLGTGSRFIHMTCPDCAKAYKAELSPLRSNQIAGTNQGGSSAEEKLRV